jgi:hypothetical protein
MAEEKNAKTLLRWVLMFRVATEEEAKRELAHAQETLGIVLRVERCERYWKIPELWTCTATSEIDAVSIADRVTQTLLLANKLAIGWYVLGPYLNDDDGSLTHFEAIYSMNDKNTVTPLLEWTCVEVVTWSADL